MNNILSSISTIKNFQFNSNRTTCNDYLYNALNDAVESMEKQIPKKPIKEWDRIKGDIIDYRFHCPVCKTEICSIRSNVAIGHKQKHCEICGQKLDWSVEE